MTSPIVKLTELAPPRVTIKCHDCGMLTRVYRVEPVTQIGAFKYCAVCGSGNASAFMNTDTDWWESMARDYGLPIVLLKQIYAQWEPHKHQRFSDFVAELRTEAAAEVKP